MELIANREVFSLLFFFLMTTKEVSRIKKTPGKNKNE
jgi:hypothetical protein